MLHTVLWAVLRRSSRCLRNHFAAFINTEGRDVFWSVFSNVCLRCACVPVCVCVSPQYLRYPQDTQPPTWQRILGLWGDCRIGRWQIVSHWRWPPLGGGCSHSVCLKMREGGLLQSLWYFKVSPAAVWGANWKDAPIGRSRGLGRTADVVV